MSALPNSVLSFRAMLESDLTEVMVIELGAYPFPWTKAIFRDCIRAGYRCQVLINHHRIDAYGIISVVAGESHILNLCVRPELHGCGLARHLLQHLLSVARSDGAKTIFLEVRPSNIVARRLYTSAGFSELGLRHHYYPAAKGREDALLMAKELS